MNAIPREVRLIDRDRREIARAGINVATKIARQAQTFASNARRFGRDPVDAANAVFLGDEDTTHASAIDVLTQVMVVSNLRGRRRTITSAAPHIEELALDRNQDRLDEKQMALLLLLLLTEEELAALRAEYGPIATKLLEEATVSLVDRINDATTPREIRRAFEDSGFSVNNPYAIDSTFSTAGVRAYEDGRFTAQQKPEIQTALWGYRYSAVLDERTTVLCRTLDETIAPKDDPIWRLFTPPNHFSCRSVLVEVWQSDALNEPDMRQTDATPSQTADFLAEKRRFLSYF